MLSGEEYHQAEGLSAGAQKRLHKCSKVTSKNQTVYHYVKYALVPPVIFLISCRSVEADHISFIK